MISLNLSLTAAPFTTTLVSSGDVSLFTTGSVVELCGTYIYNMLLYCYITCYLSHFVLTHHQNIIITTTTTTIIITTTTIIIIITMMVVIMYNDS